MVEQSLAFIHTHLTKQARPGRFGRPHTAADDVHAIKRLAAFLGRPVSTYSELR